MLRKLLFGAGAAYLFRRLTGSRGRRRRFSRW